MRIVDQEPYFNQIDGMIVGNDPCHGYDMNGVIYHPDLQFRFGIPQDWNVINEAQQVQVVESNQRAMMLLTIASDAQSPRAAVTAILNQQGGRLVEAGETTVNGLPAYAASAASTDQE